MRSRRPMLAALVLPIAASAQQAILTDEEKLRELIRPQSTIEIGAGTASGDTFLGGQWNGLRDRFVIGRVELTGSQYRYGNAEDDHVRWKISARNLGLDSRAITGEYGMLNRYRLSFGHDEIPQRLSDTYQTPFDSAGTARLTLPAGFMKGADPASMSTLATSLKALTIGSTRKRDEVGGTWWPDPDWELTAKLRVDRRDGMRLRGLEFGSSGGNARAAILPEPIDTSTHLVDVGAAFTGDSERFAFGYHGSFFRNHIESLNWQNPYSSQPWTGGATGLPAGFPLTDGRAALAPDNQFHQLHASGALDLSNTTRFNFSLSRGRMTQDEALLPYTVNASLASLALPRDSAEARVDTTQAYTRLSMRPLRGLYLNATLRFDERDNATPISEFTYLGGDIQLQPAAGANSDRVRTNLPRSRRTTWAAVDADYRFLPALAGKATVEHEVITRTFMEVQRLAEDTLKLELRRVGEGAWMVNAGLSWSVRRGTDYLANAPFLASYTSAAFIAASLAATGCGVPLDCVRLGPFQNKFFLADRDRSRVRLITGYAPGDWSLSTRLDATRDRYPDSPFGLQSSDNWTANADLTWTLSPDSAAGVFLTRDAQKTEERARQILGGAPPANPADADWVNRFADRTWTVGAHWKSQGWWGNRLSIEADAITVRGRTPIETVAGRAAPAAQFPSAPLPDLKLNSEEVKLALKYRADRDTQWKLALASRRLTSLDWAYDNLTATSFSNLIGTLQKPVSYRNTIVGVSMVKTFR